MLFTVLAEPLKIQENSNMFQSTNLKHLVWHLQSGPCFNYRFASIFNEITIFSVNRRH